jgi:hypothetical protein
MKLDQVYGLPTLNLPCFPGAISRRAQRLSGTNLCQFRLPPNLPCEETTGLMWGAHFQLPRLGPAECIGFFAADFTLNFGF